MPFKPVHLMPADENAPASPGRLLIESPVSPHPFPGRPAEHADDGEIGGCEEGAGDDNRRALDPPAPARGEVEAEEENRDGDEQHDVSGADEQIPDGNPIRQKRKPSGRADGMVVRPFIIGNLLRRDSSRHSSIDEDDSKIHRDASDGQSNCKPRCEAGIEVASPQTTDKDDRHQQSLPMPSKVDQELCHRSSPCAIPAEF